MRNRNMKKFIFEIAVYVLMLSIFFCIFGVAVFAANTKIDAEITEIEPLKNLRIEGIEELKAAFSNEVQIPAAAVASLPSSVDLTSRFPTPGNQGSLNDGIEWAICYFQANAQRNYFGWDISKESHHFNPEFLFNQKNGGHNLSTNIYDAALLVNQKGVCTNTYRTVTGTDYTTQPTDRQKENAKLYKTGEWLMASGLSTLKSVLNSGSGVLVSIRAFPDFDAISASNPVYDTVSGSKTGEYVLCLIGYDDNKGGGAFKFINSHGTSWGVNGYGWISYNLMNLATVSLFGKNTGYLPNDTVDMHDYQMGDINGDGNVTSADARLSLRFAAKLETPTNKQFVLADVNGDAKVNSSDASALQKYVAHTISHLPIYD